MRAAHFLLAFDEELQVDRQTAPFGPDAASGFDLHQDLALVVGRPSGQQLVADHHRFEGGRRPLGQGVDGLHVVVTIDKDGGSVRARPQPLGVDGRPAAPGRLRRARGEDLDRSHARLPQEPGTKLGGGGHVAGVVGVRRNRGDPQPVCQCGEDAFL